MRTLSRFGVVFTVIATWAAAPAHGARKAGGCGEGRFAVTAGQSLGDASTPTILVLTTVADGRRRLSDPRYRHEAAQGDAAQRPLGSLRRGREAAAQATARDCSAVRGTLRARKKKATLVAMPSVCGEESSTPGRESSVKRGRYAEMASRAPRRADAGARSRSTASSAAIPARGARSRRT
jgi:hypothetical protein